MTRRSASSRMPDELNENWGRNWLMDGFWHDMEYGEGIDENGPSTPEPQPSTRGVALLPGTVLMGNAPRAVDETPDYIEAEGTIDLQGLGIVASGELVDHGWLEDVYQDPERLPKQPVDRGLRELSKEWANRMEGPQRIEMRERVPVVPRILDERLDEKLTGVVRSAMRRSAAGESFEVVRDAVVAALGPAASLVEQPLRAIAAEHGLVGNVYVRASAYPGLLAGKWSRALAKAARKAKYLVGCEDCSECACALGVRRVDSPSDIDWEETYAAYAPNLAATGQLGKASSGDKRVILRRAFLANSNLPRTSGASLPTEPRAPRATREEARAALLRASETGREVVSEPRIASHAEQRFVHAVDALVAAKLLSEDEANHLRNASVPLAGRVAHAKRLAGRVRVGTFTGHRVRDPRATAPAKDLSEGGRRLLKAARESQPKHDPAVLGTLRDIQGKQSEAAAKLRSLKEHVSSGTRGKALAGVVASLFSATERAALASAIDPLLVEAGFYEKSTSNRYQGPVHKQAASTRPKAIIPEREIEAAVRTADRAMNEGYAGEELDRLLAERISLPVRKAASEPLRSLRREREGVVGSVYVDASVYASPEGTTGCEQGASVHRATGVKYLLAMPRCRSCVFKNADGQCQKYNKTLIAEVDPALVRKAQRRRLSRTQPSKTAEEGSDILAFNLSASPMDDLQTKAVPVKKALSDISFGGMYDGFE